MANVLNTLNLIQVKGGVNIKQGDSSSVLEYELGYNVGSDMMSDLNLNGKTAHISLYNRFNNTKWTKDSIVKDNRVSFTINEALGLGVYVLDIEVDGHVFPSDREMYVRVHEGYESYIDGRSAAVAVATAANIANEGIRQAIAQNLEKIKGPKGDIGPRGYTGDTGPRGPQGVASKITGSKYDSSGNTIISFNNGSPDVTVQRGKVGPKGDTGNPVNVSSVTKSGTTNTVKFTDGKTMTVEDGKSVNVSSTRILDDGNTEIIFTDGKKAIVKKGQDGTVKFDDLTEEQRKSLQVDVVDDLTSGGKDKALSAEQGKVLFNTIVKYHPDAAPPKVMTAVIDQANSNPLTCITYEDDAKMMEKGSPEWDDFFQSRLVLFKDGKEVRELEDGELNGLKPEDGDVMVRFPRKGLRIKTVGEKVYVSMTNVPNNPDFKYYAHSRGDQARDYFYLGAYLGYEESGKLRSITGKDPRGNKTTGAFRTIAQANGKGYEQMAFYQWTFLQAMYVLKYGNLDSQTCLGMGYVNGNYNNMVTGATNGKGIDYGTTDDKTKVRFQWIEDIYGSLLQTLDGIRLNSSSSASIINSNFGNTGTVFKNVNISTHPSDGTFYIKKIIGTSEGGFLCKEGGASNTTNYCDCFAKSEYANYDIAIRVGGGLESTNKAGIFYLDMNERETTSSYQFGARLMFL